MDTNQLWQSALGELELQISRPNFLTWFKDSELIAKDEQGMVTIGLPNNFAKEWVANKYHKMILAALRSFDESIRRVDYLVIDQKKRAFNLDFKAAAHSPQQSAIPEFKVDPETNLNPRYTLNSFVVGSSNELSYAASMAVVRDIGKKYNPLFVYGGTGLGKTHLIQAIGNEIKGRYKGRVKVKYVTSEKFVNDVVWAIRNKRVEDVKNKYRTVDVLVIDDIQFIGGKERSEEEFFHTFNALYENSKQIIISSDRPPAAIPTLEARLRSRFEGGMIADISYPDYEMRLAIIKTKLQERNTNLPDEVSEFIAQKIQRNVREIEGILNKILFYQEVKGVEPNLKTVEEVVSNILQQSSKNITPVQVIKAVADFFEIIPSDFINRSRKKGVVEPRQIAAFLLREILNMSYPEIGEKLGKRDHSTVIHSCEKISREITKNQSLNRKIILIKEVILKS
jgi:chromosomal replication initiator protein